MSKLQNILIVDDEIDFANGLSRMVAPAFSDFNVSVANSGEEAISFVQENSAAVMLLDLNMPGISGMDVIEKMRSLSPNTAIIVLTAYGTIETAVSALKQGAWDFLAKPVKREDLIRSLAKATEHSRVLLENSKLKQHLANSGLERTLIGDSTPMCRLRDTIAAVAASAYTVLIRGESGTGKELVAEAVHALSNRSSQPYIKVNCPAIPEQLLESELFGHVKGAFTGATNTHQGMFVQAAGGTLLLDEIGDLPMSVQAKLLRTLQDGEVRPVGSAKAVKINTRIIAATNQDLEAKIKSGEFREDLFYRLNVLTINTPPLRERKEDIPLLAALFFVQSCAEMGIEEKRLSPETLANLTRHDWPGNVRELQNFVRRHAVFATGNESETVHIETFTPAEEAQKSENLRPYKEAKQILVDTFTRSYMKEILEHTGGNISEAARVCGIERVSLQKILRRLNMEGADFKH
ncbi:sigma-54 dependent transcriptional regulator [Desulfovibrio sp. OttesenSCG-928-F07]|nr:sigma-54 dependent transcriptional regulator [Desulfovibrio sp. OttesenSCG-928-F07]